MNGPSSLKIAQIRTDGGTQPRAQLDGLVIEEYAEIMRQGVYFPPIDVIYDGKDYWLWDGFHRVEAAQKANKDSIAANVKQGTRRDAILNSVSANASHGIRRTNDDKRRAVMTLLEDDEWASWSDNEISKRCAVSQPFVSKVRSEIPSYNDYKMEPQRTATRNGKPYTVNTTNIGKSRSEPEQPVQDEDEQILDELAEDENAYDWTPEQQPILPLASKPKPDRLFLSVTEWQTAEAAQRAEWLFAQHGSNHTFNQTNENVEWASWTWNPVTGCLHNCAYCYARDIANRFYNYLPEGERFAPIFYPDRLSGPHNTKQPDLNTITDPVRRMGLHNVFVCSMADLFGKWVPTEWIQAVLQQAWDNPQWNFLFLTKFPIRMAEFEYPPNTWIGTTVDTQYAVERAEKAFRKVRATGYEGVAWLSCEPMMERLTFTGLDMFDWVIMGGSSKSTQTPAFAPPPEWWIHLWNQAKQFNLPVYQKTNLIQSNGNPVDFDGRVREYPAKVL